MPKPISKRLDILLPRRKRRAAVLVIHSWWGLTDSFRVFGRALAEEGFIVGLADLFNGKTAADVRQATQLRRTPRKEPMYKTLIRNIDELRAVDGVHSAIAWSAFQWADIGLSGCRKDRICRLGQLCSTMLRERAAFAGAAPPSLRTSQRMIPGSAEPHDAKWRPRLQRLAAPTQLSTIRERRTGLLKLTGARNTHPTRPLWRVNAPSSI